MAQAMKTVRLNGIPVRVPAEELTDPDTFTGTPCQATEPEWPGGSGGSAACTLAPHGTGPDGSAHIAHNGSWDVIAIWWDAPAQPNDADRDY